MMNWNKLRHAFITCATVPLLLSCGSDVDPMSVEKPKLVDFGAPINVIANKLKSKCDQLEITNIDPPQFASIEKQDQIDCTGFAYFGKQRDVEFIFVNDALGIVDINIDDSDVPAIEQAFISSFGTPKYAKDTVLIFDRQNAAVRNNPAQVTYFAAFASRSLTESASIRPDR